MNTRATTTEVHSEFTQQQKRDVLDDDRKARERPATFKDFASAFANETRGGRFAKSSTDQTVTPLPSGPWSAQPGPGDEPPLGMDVNAVPDLGFPLNKQTSVAQAPASPLAVETATDERGGATGPERSSSSLSEKSTQETGQ
jgi:hypothetical protein